MLKRFLTVFGLMLLYVLVLAGVLLLVILLAGENDTLILIKEVKQDGSQDSQVPSRRDWFIH